MTKQVIDSTERLNHLYQTQEDKVAEVFYEKITEWDNDLDEIVKGIVDAVNKCETAHDFDLVNSVIVAVSGWNIDSLLEMVEDRIKEGEV